MIIIPKIENEGQHAALLGTNMSGPAAPLGFVFCPYKDGSAERWNFLNGACTAYYGVLAQ